MASLKVTVANTYSLPYEENKLVRTSVLQNDSLQDCLNDGKTLYELFMRGVKTSGNKPCLGWRPGPELPYQWITYNEVLQRAQWVGSGLIAKGAKSKPTQLIGTISKNSVEHMIVKQACNSFSMAIVPIFYTATDKWLEHILELCELKIIFVDTLLNAKNLVTLMINIEFSIKLIVVEESLEDLNVDFGTANNVKIIDFAALEEIGKEKLLEFVPPKPNDLHIISFTSGTTGVPKGVMLTHKNFAVCVYSVLALMKLNYFDIGVNDVYFSFIPLSSPFEMVLKGVIFAVGARIGLHTGYSLNILEDVEELKPTILTTFPYILTKLYNANIARAADNLFVRFIMKLAMKSKFKLLKRGIITTESWWDRILLKRINRRIRGSLKTFLTGCGPINPAITDYLKCFYGTNVIYAYGLTETTSFVSYSHPLDLLPGSVGPPLCCSVVKLIDAPEQKCFIADGIGEICVKGGNVFLGYYKDKTLTKKVIDKEGWFHTGDIGTWLPNGALKILDRKQNAFVMEDGHRIFPVIIESKLSTIPFIHQMFVHGDNQHKFVVAIVVVYMDSLQSWCAKQSVKLRVSKFLDDPKVIQAVSTKLKAFGQENDLAPFEVPSKIIITDEQFSPENGLLTFFQTLKRHDIYLRYQDQLKTMLTV